MVLFNYTKATIWKHLSEQRKIITEFAELRKRALDDNDFATVLENMRENAELESYVLNGDCTFAELDEEVQDLVIPLLTRGFENRARFALLQSLYYHSSEFDTSTQDEDEMAVHNEIRYAYKFLTVLGRDFSHLTPLIGGAT